MKGNTATGQGELRFGVFTELKYGLWSSRVCVSSLPTFDRKFGSRLCRSVCCHKPKVRGEHELGNIL
jgi:hypothetical protein